MNPKVSIVIPTYNRAYELKRALDSVIAQSYPHWECLIIDNHSADDTEQVVSALKDPRIHFFSTHNRGIIAISRNLGIRHASGDYVAFLDSDDWWMTQKLAESIKYLENGADIVYHDLYKVTKVTQRVFLKKVGTRALGKNPFEDLILNGNALNNSSVVVRRSLLNKIGGLAENEEVVGAEDFFLWLAIAKLTHKFKRIGSCLGYYWSGGCNVSNPELAIKYLSYFSLNYAKEIQKISENKHLYWLSYSNGRAYYRLGSYMMARTWLREVTWKKMSVFILCKLLYMRLMLKIQRMRAR